MVLSLHTVYANKGIDVEVPMSAYLCMMTRYIQGSIFIQIINVLHLRFQCKKFESNTQGSSYVIILQTATDRTNIAIANRKSPMTFRLTNLHLTLAHSKGQGHAHFYDNISQMVTDKAKFAIANKYKITSWPFHWHIYV